MGPVQGLDTRAYLVPGIREWLIILSILHRLYTSVIPWNLEKRLPKESCPTDMSPTTILLLCASTVQQQYSAEAACAGGGVPGVVGGPGWAGRVYYPGTAQDHPRTHI